MKFDEVDHFILQSIIKDGRRKFLDIARKLRLTGGTVHARMNKYKKSDLLLGFTAQLNINKLGYDIVSFIGISLTKGADYKQVAEKLKTIPEILEIHYTTGNYSLFLKVLAKNMKDFHRLLYEEIQKIEEVEHTETILSLDTPLERQLPDPLF
jgi:Lrp/AsnC family transcriptional regulator for asnA, asnC and gidA